MQNFTSAVTYSSPDGLTSDSLQCSKASRSPKRHLPNRLRQRDKRGRPEFREIDQQLTKSAHCEGRDWHSRMVFPATQGAVQEPPVRARHHSLSRLKDANEC